MSWNPIEWMCAVIDTMSSAGAKRFIVVELRPNNIIIRHRETGEAFRFTVERASEHDGAIDEQMRSNRVPGRKAP